MWDRRVPRRLRPGVASGLLLCLGLTWGLGSLAHVCSPVGDAHPESELRAASFIAEPGPAGACPACLLQAKLKPLGSHPSQPFPTADGPAVALPPDQPVTELVAAAPNARAPPSS